MKPTALKKLQAEWYSKLSELGFNDIEVVDTGDLKVWDSQHFRSDRYSELTFEMNESYYRAAGRILHIHKFNSDLERKIWELHCDGKSRRTIAKELGCKVWPVEKLITQIWEWMPYYDECDEDICS